MNVSLLDDSQNFIEVSSLYLILFYFFWGSYIALSSRLLIHFSISSNLLLNPLWCIFQFSYDFCVVLSYILSVFVEISVDLSILPISISIFMNILNCFSGKWVIYFSFSSLSAALSHSLVRNIFFLLILPNSVFVFI